MLALAVSLLEDTWDTVAGGAKPVIVDASAGRADLLGAGNIKVYENAPFARTRNDVEAKFKTHLRRVTLQVRAADRPRLDVLLGEVDRIYGNVKKDPDTYWDWIEDLGETPQQDYPQRFWTDVLWEFRAHSIPQAT